MPATVPSLRTARLVTLAALLTGAGCGADRLPVAPRDPGGVAAHVSADNHESVVYRSLNMRGAGGFDGDATALASALSTPKHGGATTRSYASAVPWGLVGRTEAEIMAKITDTFAAADDNDVSVISISSHGDTDELNPDTGLEITAPELRATLATVRGTKIVIISACHSGSLIDGAGELAGPNTVVLVSSASDQLSRTESPMFEGNRRGHAVFIGWIVAGLSADANGRARADADQNGEVTVAELYAYAAPRTQTSATTAGRRQDPQNTFTQPGGDALRQVPILRYDQGTLFQSSATPAPEETDADQCGVSHSCSLGARSSSFVDVVVRGYFGLERIDVTKAVNVSISMPAFAPGTTEPVTTRATKVDLSLASQVELYATTSDGQRFRCDPVLVEVSRTTGQPRPMTIAGLPQAESRISVSNGTPGLTNLRVEVNGRSWQLAGMKDGETRELDVAPAMVPGERNTIVLTPLGRPGASAVVLIHD